MAGDGVGDEGDGLPFGLVLAPRLGLPAGSGAEGLGDGIAVGIPVGGCGRCGEGGSSEAEQGDEGASVSFVHTISLAPVGHLLHEQSGLSTSLILADVAFCKMTGRNDQDNFVKRLFTGRILTLPPARGLQAAVY